MEKKNRIIIQGLLGLAILVGAVILVQNFRACGSTEDKAAGKKTVAQKTFERTAAAQAEEDTGCSCPCNAGCGPQIPEAPHPNCVKTCKRDCYGREIRCVDGCSHVNSKDQCDMLCRTVSDTDGDSGDCECAYSPTPTGGNQQN